MLAQIYGEIDIERTSYATRASKVRQLPGKTSLWKKPQVDPDSIRNSSAYDRGMEEKTKGARVVGRPERARLL